MKHTMAKLIAIILITISLLFCVSCTYKNKSIYEENGISYYIGSNYCSVYDISNKAGKNVVIPAQVNGHTVTVLDDRKALFEGLFGGYETLILPETIERVDSSFYDYASKKLKYNEYDNGLYLGTADNPYFAFIKVKEVDYAEEMSYKLDEGVNDPEKEGLPPPVYVEHDTDVTSCTLHPDTKIIANNAFAGCEKLKSVTIPGGVKTIPAAAFAGCTSLVEVNFAEGVEIIALSAFVDCNSLNYIVLPSTLKEAKQIFSDKYYGREADLTVVLSEGMEYIPDGLFEECEILKNVSIPDSVKGIGLKAFYNCTNLQSINLPENLEFIDASAFYGCKSLRGIDIPDSIQEIGKQAFYGCEALEQIELPEGLNYIAERMFQECVSLISISIPSSVERIEESAFQECISLEEIEFPDGLKYIGPRAFLECASLKSISIPTSIEVINAGAFRGCQSSKTVVTPPLFTFECHYTAFDEIVEFEFVYDDIKTVIVDGSIYNEDMTVLIEYGGDSSEKTFNVPESVVYIGENSFRDSNLENIILPDTVEKIGMFAFYNCDAITSFVAPKNLSYLGDYSFTDCDALEFVKIDCQITNYSYYGIFDSCDSLKTIQLYNVEFVSAIMLRHIPSLESIEIPDKVGSGNASGYKARDGVLYNYTSYELLVFYPRGKKDKSFTVTDTRYIQDGAFRGNKYLEEIVISDSVVNINDGVFEYCTYLSKIVFLGEELRVIGDRAFKHCISLKEVVIPNRVESIGESAFEGCINLESVVIGNWVGWIKDNAFLNCTSLRTVELGERVEYIYDGAFIGCNKLEKIVIPENIGKIMGVAFEEQVEIYFKGKKSQWEGEKSWWGDVKKGNKGGYYVHCSDGDLWVNRSK